MDRDSMIDVHIYTKHTNFSPCIDQFYLDQASQLKVNLRCDDVLIGDWVAESQENS